eukprot:413328-Pyramimonas_sp.AAC.1
MSARQLSAAHWAVCFLFPWRSASAVVDWVYVVNGEACQQHLKPRIKRIRIGLRTASMVRERYCVY